MNVAEEKKVVVELFVTPSTEARPLFENLVRGEGLTVNLRRARLTTRDAWLQLDVSGAAAAVDAFVRGCRDEFPIAIPAADNVA